MVDCRRSSALNLWCQAQCRFPPGFFFFILFYFFKAQGMHNDSGPVRLGTMLERRRVVNNVKYKVCREAEHPALDQMH